MNSVETNLFKKLCSYLTVSSEELERSIGWATPSVLGMLFYNRMQAIAYGSLENAGLLSKTNREFRNSLKDAYEYNVMKNNSYFEAIGYMSDLLKDEADKYAMLKGAVLCRKYPMGYRTSNDIDLLVRPEDITDLAAALRRAGFLQGRIRKGMFYEASRREIIESRMMRGETVPFIKEINMPGMRYLEADINFSLDYKNGSNESLEKIMESSVDIIIDGVRLRTLSEYDFILHLCGHLYKEATTLPWVEMRRDMTMYKYCDIYMCLNNMTEKQLMDLFDRAGELNMTSICCFAILQTAELFINVNPIAISMAKRRIMGNESIMHKVVSPAENKVYKYSQTSVSDRFFDWNRKYSLMEAEHDGA